MPEESNGDAPVLVQVVEVVSGDGDIGWRHPSAPEALENRTDDLARAVHQGTSAVCKGIEGLPKPTDMVLDEITVSFGIALTVEAGVLITKVGGGATMDVTIKFARPSG